MANGFAPYILQHIKEIAKGATPQNKIELPGFTQSLITAHSKGVIKNDTGFGQYRTVQVKKKQRYTAADTSTEASCDVTNVQGYTEDTVSVANYRQLAVHIEDEVIAGYEAYANNPTGLIGASVSPEFIDEMMLAANGLLSAVNADLVTLAAAAIGKNRRTGLTTASTINIGKDQNVLSLTDGLTQIMSDMRLNNMSGKPIIVGSGLFNNFMLQQASKQGGFNGLDTRIQAAGVDFFYDNDIASIIDDNSIIAYEKDAVQFVQYLKYRGPLKSGYKGTSWFGVAPLPVMTTNASGGLSLVPMEFDVQLKYNDCEADFTVDGQSETLQKGWNMILSTNFGLWTIPSTSYKASDPLTGNRGSLLYNITNDCDSCDGTGY